MHQPQPISTRGITNSPRYFFADIKSLSIYIENAQCVAAICSTAYNLLGETHIKALTGLVSLLKVPLKGSDKALQQAYRHSLRMIDE